MGFFTDTAFKIIDKVEKKVIKRKCKNKNEDFLSQFKDPSGGGDVLANREGYEKFHEDD